MSSDNPIRTNAARRVPRASGHFRIVAVPQLPLLSADAGPELDREIERQVFRGSSNRPVPPFSTEDWTATALGELLARQTGWSFESHVQGDQWSAMWVEYAPGSGRVLSLITATAPTRALAICRSLLKATRCPRWRRASAVPPSTHAEG